jgi:hypothetical protein
MHLTAKSPVKFKNFLAFAQKASDKPKPILTLSSEALEQGITVKIIVSSNKVKKIPFKESLIITCSHPN